MKMSDRLANKFTRRLSMKKSGLIVKTLVPSRARAAIFHMKSKPSLVGTRRAFDLWFEFGMLRPTNAFVMRDYKNNGRKGMIIRVNGVVMRDVWDCISKRVYGPLDRIKG